MTSSIIRGSIGLICALVWLILLVVTNFSPLPVGAGLLAALYLSGSSARPARR